MGGFKVQRSTVERVPKKQLDFVSHRTKWVEVFFNKILMYTRCKSKAVHVWRLWDRTEEGRRLIRLKFKKFERGEIGT
jgi:hypothetical protein